MNRTIFWFMDWPRILAYITGTVDQELLLAMSIWLPRTPETGSSSSQAASRVVVEHARIVQKQNRYSLSAYLAGETRRGEAADFCERLGDLVGLGL